MDILEKVAYLKGLSDGMKLDENKDENKLIKGILDLLGDIAVEIGELNENSLDLAEEIDNLNEDLSLLEDEVYDDDDDDECCDCDCCCCDDDDDDEDDDDEEPIFYEVTCPKCGKTIVVDEDVLLCEAIDCPSCGEKLELEFDEDDDGEDE